MEIRNTAITSFRPTHAQWRMCRQLNELFLPNTICWFFICGAQLLVENVYDVNLKSLSIRETSLEQLQAGNVCDVQQRSTYTIKFYSRFQGNLQKIFIR